MIVAGCVACDEESYDVFRDLFDPVIEMRHNGYTPDKIHSTDLDPSKLQGGDDLDTNYVISCRVRTGRNVRGLALPPTCTIDERRKVESIAKSACGASTLCNFGKKNSVTLNIRVFY